MTKCLECGKNIRTIDEPIKVRNGWNCQGCYYEQLGKLVEQHPIVANRPQRKKNI